MMNKKKITTTKTLSFFSHIAIMYLPYQCAVRNKYTPCTVHIGTKCRSGANETERANTLKQRKKKKKKKSSTVCSSSSSSSSNERKKCAFFHISVDCEICQLQLSLFLSFFFFLFRYFCRFRFFLPQIDAT